MFTEKQTALTTLNGTYIYTPTEPSLEETSATVNVTGGSYVYGLGVTGNSALHVGTLNVPTNGTLVAVDETFAGPVKAATGISVSGGTLVSLGAGGITESALSISDGDIVVIADEGSGIYTEGGLNISGGNVVTIALAEDYAALMTGSGTNSITSGNLTAVAVEYGLYIELSAPIGATASVSAYSDLIAIRASSEIPLTNGYSFYASSEKYGSHTLAKYDRYAHYYLVASDDSDAKSMYIGVTPPSFFYDGLSGTYVTFDTYEENDVDPTTGFVFNGWYNSNGNAVNQAEYIVPGETYTARWYNNTTYQYVVTTPLTSQPTPLLSPITAEFLGARTRSRSIMSICTQVQWARQSRFPTVRKSL